MPISVYLYGAHTLRFLYTLIKLFLCHKFLSFVENGIPEAKRLQFQGLSLLKKKNSPFLLLYFLGTRKKLLSL